MHSALRRIRFAPHLKKPSANSAFSNGTNRSRADHFAHAVEEKDGTLASRFRLEYHVRYNQIERIRQSKATSNKRLCLHRRSLLTRLPVVCHFTDSVAVIPSIPFRSRIALNHAANAEGGR